MLDKIKNEQGYALFESLVGLMLLGIVSFSFIVALPILLEKSARLDHEQQIYHQLFELHGRDDIIDIIITEPVRFTATRRESRWCATYVWRDGIEKIICL